MSDKMKNDKSKSNMKKKLAVLYAPAHYYLDEVHCGSELYWSYGIIHGLGMSGTIFGDALTGYVVGSPDFGGVHVHQLNPGKSFEPGIVTALSFMKRYFLAARLLLKKQDYNIIHHVLPFGAYQTFNLLPLLHYTRHIPFVIGPLQMPLSYFSSDEQATNARKFRENGSALRYWLFYYGVKIAKPILGFLSKKTLKKADIVVAINEGAKKYFQKIVPNAKIVIIPPGIDIQRYSFVPFQEKNKESFRILSVGHLVKRKGVDLLLRGAAPVIKKFPSVYVDIVGDGPQKEALQKLTEELGIGANVVFHGFVPNIDVASYYAKAHIFVAMSLSDSFGQMFIEAMASGLPVISSKTNGSEEIILHEKTGYLIDQRDVSALTTNLFRFAEQFYRKSFINLEQLSLAGRKRTEETYAWPVIIAQYQELYRTIISQHHDKK